MRNLDNEDYRHPLYNGDWKRSIPYKDKDIGVDDLDEPHIKRKNAILAKYPEITQLYGIATSTKWICMAVVLMQMSLAYYFGRVNTDSFWLYCLCFYFVGGSATQISAVVIHEAAHCLCATTMLQNRLVGLMANLIIPVPIAASFRRYHLEHHAYQGVQDKDPDLPLKWEINYVKGNPFLKLMFLFFYPLMYVVRGAAMQKAPSQWEVINAIVIISTDILVYSVCGLRGLLYLFLSLWFGFGIHPAAAHFIQEHFTWVDGQETYSYYGSLNNLFLNIGYHNEHHDFTKVHLLIPGTLDKNQASTVNCSGVLRYAVLPFLVGHGAC
jgi:sphingolipid delta-4 desaturase